MVSGNGRSEAEEYSWHGIPYQTIRDIGANLYDNITRNDGNSTVDDKLVDPDEYLEKIRRDF